MEASNPDSALTMLAARPRDKRHEWLTTLPVSLLRNMADLCGYDAEMMSKKQAIDAILEGF
jgi:hypothetical protein